MFRRDPVTENRCAAETEAYTHPSMDWLLAGLIGAAMFWLGSIRGYGAGLKDGRALEAVQRRISELR